MLRVTRFVAGAVLQTSDESDFQTLLGQAEGNVDARAVESYAAKYLPNMGTIAEEVRGKKALFASQETTDGSG